MKKIISVSAVMILLLSLLAMTSCGKSVFQCTDVTEKMMSIEAENASKDDFFAAGSLEVADGEQIVVSSDLEEGALKLDFVSADGYDDIDEVPEMDEDALATAEVRATEIRTFAIAGGTYMVRAAVTEKATGTVKIEVKSAEAESGKLEQSGTETEQ